MKNVIDMTERLKNQAKTRSEGKAQTPAQIVDMVEKREEMISSERRRVKRTILSEFVGAFVLVPRKGLLKVNLFDISENGLAFDMDEASGYFQSGEEVAMRVYLNQQTYFPFLVTVQNIRALNDEKIHRHGAGFIKGSINDEALHHFVKFIETVSASLKSDAGDIMVSGLSR